MEVSWPAAIDLILVRGTRVVRFTPGGASQPNLGESMLDFGSRDVASVSYFG